MLSVLNLRVSSAHFIPILVIQTVSLRQNRIKGFILTPPYFKGHNPTVGMFWLVYRQIYAFVSCYVLIKLFSLCCIIGLLGSFFLLNFLKECHVDDLDLLNLQMSGAIRKPNFCIYVK